MPDSEVKEYEYFFWPDRRDGAATDKKDTPPVIDVLNYVFVYGTLLRGQGNHAPYLGSSWFVGEGTTAEQFVMFGAGVPFVRAPQEDDNPYLTGNIRGELYGVTDQVLSSLDRLEGHPNFYERRITSIEEYPDKMVWMYHWNSDKSIYGEEVTPDPTIKLIDWRRHKRGDLYAI